MLGWDDVAKIGSRFPDVEVSTSYGTPALKVRKKLMCRMRTDPDALVLRVIDMGEREALLQGDPDVFFTTPHYDGYPYVLVRLERADPVELAELIEEVWRLRAPKRLVSEYDASRPGPARRLPRAVTDLPHFRTIADHYRAGAGEPVLLIHGFTATWRAWGDVPARLAQEYDVLAVTLPGHTDGPPLPEGDSIPLLLDALEAMLDEVGWRDAHLVGFSLGGWLSLELAKRGRARTVTAVSPGGAETERHDSESRRIKWLFARLHIGARMMLPLTDDMCRRPRTVASSERFTWKPTRALSWVPSLSGEMWAGRTAA